MRPKPRKKTADKMTVLSVHFLSPGGAKYAHVIESHDPGGSRKCGSSKRYPRDHNSKDIGGYETGSRLLHRRRRTTHRIHLFRLERLVPGAGCRGALVSGI